MKNALVTWQSLELASTVRRSALPTVASASVRTRAFDATTLAGTFTGIAASAAATPCAMAHCAHATAVAAHRGSHAWRPPIC